ncbi:MAG: hypothetical protein ISS34_00485 [Candidatus Omnitrophica bacterium]|nr:hypothetical protein [Candidatus Omnitrophota bacterium]
MRKISIFMFSVFTFVFFSMTPCALSQEKKDDEIAELKTLIKGLKSEIDEMQRCHRQEVNALREDIREIRETRGIAAKEESDVEALRRLAQEEAVKEEERKEPDDTVFKHGGLALQKLNPEISITGDMVNAYTVDAATDRYDFDFRNLGIHFESYLDPYTRFKAAIPVTTSSASIGEAYLTRYGVLKDVNLTMGKFRQQFGVVNRWHKHALDQVDFPLVLRQIFGNGGLNQSGISLDWTMPTLFGSSQELIVQGTNGENDRVFSGNVISIPSVLARYKNYRDLSKNTYLELGLTGLLGWNRDWDVRMGGATITKKDYKHAACFGADFTVLWEPTERMRHRNLEWRSELYWLNKGILAPDDSGSDTLNAWGTYSYLQAKVSRTLDIGIRGDFYMPDDKDYASVPGLSLAPLAHTEDNAYQWQIGPYITWWQSPFVKFRLEYNHLDGERLAEPEDKIMLQAVFAVGPHKHERY